MANNVCVFCGEKPGVFQSTTVLCGGIPQTACATCKKQLEGLDDAEICRRALIHGLAEEPERLKAKMELITEAENQRPKCLRCNGKLTFMQVQELDNSPMRDSVFNDPFRILPAYCTSCGKLEFYHP